MNADAPALFARTRDEPRAVGAFNAILLEHAEAIVAGAEQADLPVILQVSQNAIRYHGSLEPFAVACLRLAAGASVPVLVHLDHIEDRRLVDEGLALGIRSIMFDAAALSYEANVDRTREVTGQCHAAGCWVEAELGEIGGK